MYIYLYIYNIYIYCIHIYIYNIYINIYCKQYIFIYNIYIYTIYRYIYNIYLYTIYIYIQYIYMYVYNVYIYTQYIYIQYIYIYSMHIMYIYFYVHYYSISNFPQYGQMEKKRCEESEKRKSQKEEDAGARKGSKVAKHCVFPMICGSGGSKSRLAKAAGAEPSGEMRDEQLHAVVARSTFQSQNEQITPRSGHCWALRRWKTVRRCGAKHLPKSKHTIVGALLDVQMMKKRTMLWREAHFGKAHHVRSTFGRWDVEKVYAVVAPSAFGS